MHSPIGLVHHNGGSQVRLILNAWLVPAANVRGTKRCFVPVGLTEDRRCKNGTTESNEIRPAWREPEALQNAGSWRVMPPYSDPIIFPLYMWMDPRRVRRRMASAALMRTSNT